MYQGKSFIGQKIWGSGIIKKNSESYECPVSPVVCRAENQNSRKKLNLWRNRNLSEAKMDPFGGNSK